MGSSEPNALHVIRNDINDLLAREGQVAGSTCDMCILANKKPIAMYVYMYRLLFDTANHPPLVLLLAYFCNYYYHLFICTDEKITA